MSDVNEIQYWHTYVDGGLAGCASMLAGGIRCHARRDQHLEDGLIENEASYTFEPELPVGMDRELEWEATRDQD